MASSRPGNREKVVAFPGGPGEPPGDPEVEASSRAAFGALLRRRGGDVLLVVDARLRIMRAGPDAARLAERPFGALTGMSLIAAFGSVELDAVARESLTTNRPASGEAQLGHLGSRTIRVDALPTGSGGLVIVLVDLTALRRIERVRRDFVANVSHELRTPLSSIKLLAETLSSGAATDPQTSVEFAQQIEREVDHLTRLVDELLDLSMIESGQTSLNLEAVSPGELVAPLLDRMRPLAERRGVRLRDTSSPGVGSSVLADPMRLSQALVNLIHNAIKFSHAGGEVRIGWRAVGGGVRLLVADDGIGIPAAHQARIFERFYKVDRSRVRDGESEAGSAGLGLAIVQHIAEAHGGTVGVESREGSGSTFWIELPRAG